MPRNQFQRMIFALLTVIITVHGYVFYSLYVVNGKLLMEITGAAARNKNISAERPMDETEASDLNLN